MFAKHVSDQQFADELPIQLGIQSFLPGIKYRSEHVLESHDGVVKESVKEAKRELRRDDEQLPRLGVFQVRLQMFDEGIETLVGIGKSPCCLDQAAMKTFTLVAHERVEQFILRGKVTVERSP